MMRDGLLSLRFISPVLLLYISLISSCPSRAVIPPGYPNASIPQGQLQGRWLTTRDGRIVSGFLSIPYADAPIGPLRFKAAQPPPSWAGVYQATREAPGCIQQVGDSNNPIRPTAVSEDCLYINVFTPEVTSSKKFPVIVYIYGGGFETGSGNSSAYGPDYLLDEDVILVTFNYRGGILGFLSAGHPVLSGNLGLKDQRSALRWVNKNIEHFGGDPNRVTLYGNSAGAVSVELHMIFTAKEGLFRAGMSSSGSSWSAIGLQGPDRPLLDRLTQLTNCPRGPPEELVECLRSIPANDFETFRQQLQKTSLETKKHVPVFRPVIEPLCVTDPFITVDPWLTTTTIPLLQGSTQLDGLVRTIEFANDKTDRKFMELNENYKSVLPYNYFFEETSDRPIEVAERLKRFYFGDANIDRDHYINLVDLVSDALFNYPLVLSTRANHAKTYVYNFNYKGSNTYVHFLGSKEYYGVGHVDDQFFTFPIGGPAARNITAADTRVSKQYVKMLVNFATNLDPTPEGHPVKWTPVRTRSVEFLNITQDSFVMQSGYLKQRMDFWDSLPYRNIQQKGWSCQNNVHCS